MKALWLALAGACGGVLAGMGMGGGTLTIPLLVLALSVGQLAAQFINLVAFLPTGAAALGVHLKNGLVDSAPLFFVLPPALVMTAAASVFAGKGGEVLGKAYGAFLVAVALFGLAQGAFPCKK